MLKIHDFFRLCLPVRPSPITHPSILASLRSGTPEGCTRLGYWFARLARHMRLNFARFARSRTSCARASRATCAWTSRASRATCACTSRASRATCAWTSRASRAYTSKIEEMAEKKFALRAPHALELRALRAPLALELRARLHLKNLKKLLHFFLKRPRRIRKS